MSKLFVCLDLGSDVLKIAFAYRNGDRVEYGKFSKNDLIKRAAIPAVAFYQKNDNSWLYGSEVQKTNGDYYMTVVKIKSLLELLSFKVDNVTTQSNRDFYFNHDCFPKFYFPVRRTMLDDFAAEVDKNRTFTAKGFTPQAVVEAFFDYVGNFVDEQALLLSKSRSVQFDDFEIAVVNPPKIGKEYVAEIKRVIERTFGLGSVKKVMPSTKAISIYASQVGVLAKGESCLVFDMGEEDISVAQAVFTEKYGILLDGVEGHSEPIDLGGLDVDEAIYNYIEKSIYSRETVGSPSEGESGHIYESSVLAKQYLLMQDIKRLKAVMSFKGGALFPNGVPISVHREVIVQRVITKDEFKQILIPVADKIANYVIDELKRPINGSVTKVILSGGLIETYGLLTYLKNRIAAAGLNHKIVTLGSADGTSDRFSVLSNEKALYSSAVGGALIAAWNIDVKTTLSLSYATWSGNSSKKLLKIFASRGAILNSEENTFVTKLRLKGVKIDGEEMYSCICTPEEIDNDSRNIPSLRKYKNVLYDGKTLVVGSSGTTIRRHAEDDLSLKVVSGGEDSNIKLYYDGSEVVERDENAEFYFYEGIKVDDTGRATPYIEAAAENYGKMYIRCENGVARSVYKKDITVSFTNVHSFDTVQG